MHAPLQGSKVCASKPFPCEVCPKAFPSLQAACSHMRMKHKQEPRCVCVRAHLSHV